ncbi:hypothetical protein ACO2Q0_20115 [Phenylobacterium sp. VNQ135]|uniref:hypothetical protein n=1 Tax=Phenylobacterium sp. VNQ135 TaxID=3400922 RepID=UPI003BFAB68E
MATPPRSGSTWLFNAARLFLSEDAGRLWSGWVDDFPDGGLDGRFDTLLVKLHAPDQAWLERGQIVLTCHRDLRDVAASYSAMSWAESEYDIRVSASFARNCHEFWSPHAALDLRYERIVVDPEEALGAVRQAVGLPTAVEETRRVAAELASMAERSRRGESVPKGSLLHPGHVTDGRSGGWTERLPAGLAEDITRDNLEWLRAHQYEG